MADDELLIVLSLLFVVRGKTPPPKKKKKEKETEVFVAKRKLSAMKKMTTRVRPGDEYLLPELINW